MLLDLLRAFAKKLKSIFDLPGSANPEDQLKAPVSELLKRSGEETGLHVETKTEAHVTEESVRPDMAVYVAGLISGYVELKQPGLGANAPKLRGKHNKAQWERLKSIPNLIYTDGQEWALYRNGELVGRLLRFSGDPSEKGTAAVTAEDAKGFEALLRDFLGWKPVVPHRPTELAAYLAPLTRFLRSEVEQALREAGSNVTLLAAEWRQYFFPDADDARFADAYAQTVTYALLLARLNGAMSLEPAEAAKTLDKGNRLLARALELLGQPGARDELRVGFELLQRSLEALDPAEFLKTKPDLWLYFYEDFLAAYDPKLRNDYGVYYTPREVVELQVRLASELLDDRFNKKLGFADDGVVFIDPGVGTGTYLVAAVSHALEKVRTRSGEGAIAGRASQMAENMYAFEVLVGPYAVAHLRVTQAIEGVGGSLPGDGRLKIYLADTLESPHASPPGGLTLTYKELTQEHEAARKIKQGGDILVCLGNPPYDRQQIEEGDEVTQRKGGWVRFGDQIEGGARQEEQGERPILEDFLEPARKAGAGVHLKNLYNDYVYFWRWALWRLFEQQDCGGILTFITASSYLAGPGFIGMREVMRRTFDELWIIDLGGDNLGTRKTPNVFNIQTPVAIAIGIRGPKTSSETPAEVRYAKIEGDTRDAKLAQLAAIEHFKDLKWKGCPSDWDKPFLPAGKGSFFEWPMLSDIFPWIHSGVQFKRSWPIAESGDALEYRWNKLRSSESSDRPKLFRETRDRKITSRFDELKTVAELDSSDPPPDASPYIYRSFDRRLAFLDVRLGDYLRPALLRALGERQVFLSTLFHIPLGKGQAMIASSLLPDMDHFRGSFGAKAVMPLYRDADSKEPNIVEGLLELLSATYDTPVKAEDLAAYVYALLGSQSYTARFWNELETPGPRVPVTKDGDLFQKVIELGRRLIWLHTYGERFKLKGASDQIPTGAAKAIDGVPTSPNKYPETFEYRPISQEVIIGEGRFGPVAPEIWEFEVSGLKIVQSWLAYRMKERAGRKSSPLDDIRPERWTARMTDEFLELLWVLEATLKMEPKLAAVLDAVVSGPCFKESELPQPSDEERKPPKVSEDELSDQLSLLDGEEEEEEDDEDADSELTSD